MTILETPIKYRKQKKMSFTEQSISTITQSSFGYTLNEIIELNKASREELYTLWQYLRFNGMLLKDIAKTFGRSDSGISYGIEQFENLYAAKDIKIITAYNQLMEVVG